MATKKCPFCAEEIQEEAIVCKHCHSNLADKNKPTATTPADRWAQKMAEIKEVQTQQQEKAKEKREQRKVQQKESLTFLLKVVKDYWKHILGALVGSYLLSLCHLSIAETVATITGWVAFLSIMLLVFTPWKFKYTVFSLFCVTLVLCFTTAGVAHSKRTAEEERKEASDPTYKAQKDQERAEGARQKAAAAAAQEAENARIEAENAQKEKSEAALQNEINKLQAKEMAEEQRQLELTLLENGAVGYTVDKVYTPGLINPIFLPELKQAISLKDVEGMEAMTNSGKIAMIAPKTKVRKLDTLEKDGATLTHFRVMEGDYRTMDFYITQPWLVKKKGEYLHGVED